MSAEVAKIIEDNYFDRQGPIISHCKPGKTFKYGTREFTAKKSSIGVLVKDIPREYDPSI